VANQATLFCYAGDTQGIGDFIIEETQKQALNGYRIKSPLTPRAREKSSAYSQPITPAP